MTTIAECSVPSHLSHKFGGSKRRVAGGQIAIAERVRAGVVEKLSDGRAGVVIRDRRGRTVAREVWSWIVRECRRRLGETRPRRSRTQRSVRQVFRTRATHEDAHAPSVVQNGKSSSHSSPRCRRVAFNTPSRTRNERLSWHGSCAAKSGPKDPPAARERLSSSSSECTLEQTRRSLRRDTARSLKTRAWRGRESPLHRAAAAFSDRARAPRERRANACDSLREIPLDELRLDAHDPKAETPEHAAAPPPPSATERERRANACNGLREISLDELRLDVHDAKPEPAKHAIAPRIARLAPAMAPPIDFDHDAGTGG